MVPHFHVPQFHVWHFQRPPLCTALISNHTVAVRHQWFDARLPGSSMDLVRGLGHDRTFAPGTFAPPSEITF